MENAKTARIPGFSARKRKELQESEALRLENILGRFAGSERTIAKCLIDEIAFMNVELSEAKAIIAKAGIIEIYQNGENQKGYKKSSAVETYDKLVNSRLRCIKQLIDMLPPPAISADGPPEEEKPISPEDEIREFLSSGQDLK